MSPKIRACSCSVSANPSIHNIGVLFRKKGGRAHGERLSSAELKRAKARAPSLHCASLNSCAATSRAAKQRPVPENSHAFALLAPHVGPLCAGRVMAARPQLPEGARFGYANISGAIIPSLTFVTGPVIRIAKSSPISIPNVPPGMCTVTAASTSPSLRATAAEALLLLPDASV